MALNWLGRNNKLIHYFIQYNSYKLNIQSKILMGLIEGMEAYRILDLSYIAKGDEDSKQYCKSLNVNEQGLEQLSNGLWFSNDFLNFLKENNKEFKFSKIKDIKIKEFGLYSVVEELEEEIDYSYTLIAKNPADALKTLIDPNLKTPEDYNKFEISPFSKSLILTEKAILSFSKAIQTQDIIED